MSCTSKTTTLDCFFEEYMKDLEELPAHIFRAEWQQKQMRCCINALQDDDAVLCMDYAENYKCGYQEEVQSPFFNQNQVTIHPMMCYYQEDNTLVKHAIIGVTDDPKKDNAGVLKIGEAALEIIEKNKGKKLRNLNEFTDGCACQYKGKSEFHDLSKKSHPQITRISMKLITENRYVMVWVPSSRIPATRLCSARKPSLPMLRIEWDVVYKH